jgi:predicted AAA+ superfamily ATPase
LKLENSFRKDTPIKRIFVDEITSIPKWELIFKRLWDQGHLRDILVITTGSKAFDLRRGAERLPGRKGKLPKNEYIFLPVSYRDFYEKCSQDLGEDAWIAYLLSGGSPIACNEIHESQKLPEYFIQLIKDWVLGELVSTGRNRINLSILLRNLFRFGGNPIGYAKLARESGLANNTIANEYIEILSDLLCVLPSFSWDPNRKIQELRKACKFHFINLSCAIAFSEFRLRDVHDFKAIPAPAQGVFIEWLVAQELWRRSVLAGEDNLDSLTFWQSKEHELDFVIGNHKFVEVKRGKVHPIDFAWFQKIYPKGELTVIGSTPFAIKQVRGVSIHEFLMGNL